MRELLIPFILIISSLSCLGQDTILYKSWVDNQGSLFEINNKQIITDGDTYRYKISHDTLLLRQYNHWNDARFKDVIFKIKKLSNDSLILKPLNRTTLNLYKNQSIIRLVDIQLVKDDSFIFEKLYFSSSTCYGYCPAFQLVIESNRNVKFISEKNTGITKGYYKGFLTRKEYSKLLELLRKYPIDCFPSNYIVSIDGPVHHLIVWHSGNKKEIKGGIDSLLTQDLMTFLYTCNKKAILWPTFKRFNIL